MARRASATAATIGRTAGRWQSLASADFPVALAAPVLGKSAHFALHHLAEAPRRVAARAPESVVLELSTDAAPKRPQDVDNISVPGPWWIGLVVPKRHAKRSVTRSLIKRQMRAYAQAHRDRLAPGQWVIRLRAPFGASAFTSAASVPLREAAREELAHLFATVVAE